MQNCIAAVIDIAQHIAAEKLSSPPESYSDAILSLGSIGALDQAFAEEFARVAKLRNVLVHLYAPTLVHSRFSCERTGHRFISLTRPKAILRKYCRSSSWDQFRCMVFAQLTYSQFSFFLFLFSFFLLEGLLFSL